MELDHLRSCVEISWNDCFFMEKIFLLTFNIASSRGFCSRQLTFLIVSLGVAPGVVLGSELY